MKNPRIYEELAAVARDRGYAKVTAAAIHDWRKRGLLPHARGLTRRPHKVAELPRELVERLLAICRYRYDEDVRDLRLVGLLLWLDGQELHLDAIRSALVAVGSLPRRLVNTAGSRARAAYPNDQDADIEAAAAAIDREKSALAELSGGTADAPDIWAGAHDTLQVALGRMPAGYADADALSGLARVAGLDRAASEGVAGEDPWLKGKSAGSELIVAISSLFGGEAETELTLLRERDIAEIREIAIDLIGKLEVIGRIFAAGFPIGTAGLGALAALAEHPSRVRPLIAFAVARNPAASRTFAEALHGLPFDEWREALGLADEYVRRHPEIQAEIPTKGLVQILEEGRSRTDN